MNFMSKKTQIKVCFGGRCRDNFSEDLLKEAKKKLADHPGITVESRSCMCFCDKAPNVEVVDEDTGQIKRYHKVTPNELNQILDDLI
jgi:NADH:ubiquinone oxidoreductase subunit E